MRRHMALLKPTFLLLLTAACSGGSIDGEQPGPHGSDTGANASGDASGTSANASGTTAAGGTAGATVDGTTGTAVDGTTGVPLSPDPSTACPTQSLPRTPLRRLTRFEYRNSVRDLLDVDTSPVDDLPADEVTNSFDNNAGVLTVSSLHAEKYVLVSEALAKEAVENLGALTSCDTATTGEEACARQFAQSFGRRAFRHPLTANDEQMLMTAYAAGRDGGSYLEGIEVMIRAALQSPNFLYRLEILDDTGAGGTVPLGPFELATRLSYLIWGSGPDDALLDAAQNGQLASKDQIAAKAREMLASPKARVSLTNFFNQWSGLSRLDITTKNTTLFPNYSDALGDAMAEELPAFLDYLLTSGDASLDALLTANVAFVTPSLASVYGVAAPPGSETTPTLVNLPAEQGRAGLLTQAGFLSVQGHPDQTSPVLRGKFVRAMLLCDPPPPPPDNVNISIPDVDTAATARERFSAHLSAGASCNGCHSLMDPIGLAFENFDAMGQYRQTENGQAIDASGEVLGAPDPALEGPFTGVRELAEKLASSELVQDCVATQLFRFAAGRSEGSGDACSIATLQDAFTASGGDLVELVVAMTQTDAFLYRSQVTE